MKSALYTWKLAATTAFLAGFTSCSQKSEFADKPRGEEPYSDAQSADILDPSNPDGGTPGARWKSDFFQQSSRSKVDVLWVIDNSASMEPYQTMLAENIDSFLDVAGSWSANIRMGLTSTDMCEAQRPQDLSKVMCPDKPKTTPGLRGKLAEGRVIEGLGPEARADFSRLARLGVNGSSFEHGLSAAKAAVQQSLAGHNGGLVRPDSFLSIVIVSDEEDDGVGLSRTNEEGINWWDEGRTRYKFTADDLVSYLREIRPNGQFSVSSVVGLKRQINLDGPCSGNGSLEAGSEQSRASALTGGFLLDICSTDWSAGLGAMAENFASQASSFNLSRKPSDASKIEVWVSGVQVFSGWTYVESRQSIVFDAQSLPDFGEAIDVRYPY